MTPTEKANQLVDNYRMLLMNEDTDCGNEILCTMIAKKCALIAVDEIISICPYQTYIDTLCPYDGAELSVNYWEEVKIEIEKL